MEVSAGRHSRQDVALRDRLRQIAKQAPGKTLGSAVSEATDGTEHSLAPRLVLEAAGTRGEADRATETMALAMALLEGAEAADAGVHGLAAGSPQCQNSDNIAAALAGGWLRARATELIADRGDAVAAKHTQALARMAEGWILAAEDLYDAGRSPDRYCEATEACRGTLGSLSAALGALAVGRPPKEVEALERYGARVAVADEIRVEVAALGADLSPDLAGEPLVRGSYGLPVIRSIEYKPELAQSLGGAIKPDDLDRLRSGIRQAGGLGRAARDCRDLISEAIAAIEHLDDSEPLGSLAAGIAEECEEAART